MLMRTLIAIICFLIFFAILPPLSRIIGFPLTPDVLLIVRLLGAAFCLLYILTGKTYPS